MVTIKGNTLINKGLLVDACGEGHYMSSTLYIMSSLLYICLFHVEQGWRMRLRVRACPDVHLGAHGIHTARTPTRYRARVRSTICAEMLKE
jgi:hypothetical protein